MNCAICGAVIPPLSREALKNLGYCGVDITDPVKRNLVFCPKHSAVEVAEKIKDIVLGEDGAE